MPTDFATLLPRLDRTIRDGHGAQAVAELEKIGEGKVPRPHAAQVAHLAWRAGIPQLGLRLLNPIVRPREKAPVIASQLEQAEYAACLLKAGAWDEATALLKGLAPGEIPRVWLYRAFAAVARWDYRASIPLLESYLAERKLAKYQRLVGEVNLAAAFVHERAFRKATPLLRHLLYQSSVQRSHLVLGRVLELSAENFLEQKKWDQAEEFLKRAESVLEGSQGIDLFFVKKFRAVIRFRRGEKGALEAVRAESRERRHWETLRDLDRVQAVFGKSSELLNHLFYGTPFATFRDHLVSEASDWKPAEKYRWRMGGDGRGPVVLVGEGKRDGGKSGLKEGHAVHRLLLVLASDFYRPFRTATLCALLYPDEHFHPEHSPTKLRQVLMRLREWLDAEKLPIEVSEESGNYRLTASEPVTLELSLKVNQAVKERPTLVIEQLRDKFPEGFGASEAADALGLSARAMQRLLEKALASQLIDRLGKGKKTRYHFREKLPATGS